MANVLNKTTKQLLQSVNTPDYDLNDWIINPDLKIVGSINSEFWIINPDNSIRLMNDTEKNASFLNDEKNVKKTLINQYRDALIHNNGYVYNGNRFDSDLDSSIKVIAGTLTASILVSQGGDLPLDFVWRDYDNIDRPMNAATMIDFGTNMFNYGVAVYKASWVHKANIDALTTIDEVEQYDITTGWPAN